jgi:hypothetical protein
MGILTPRQLRRAMPGYLDFDSPLSPHISVHVSNLAVRLDGNITLYEIMGAAITLFSSLGRGIQKLELVYIGRTLVEIKEEETHHGYSIIETVSPLFV